MDKLLGLLGFAVKAGACVFGAQGVEKGVKSGKVRLALYDCALSERSQKDVQNMCAYYDTPYIKIEPEGALGRACGKAGKLVGVTQTGFAEKLMEINMQELRRYNA